MSRIALHARAARMRRDGREPEWVALFSAADHIASIIPDEEAEHADD